MSKAGRGPKGLASRSSFPVGKTLVLLALATILSGCGFWGSSSSSKPKGVKGSSEVALQPVSSKGKNPFTPPVGKGKAGIRPPHAAVKGAGLKSYSGNLPGLYGGTRDVASCDPQQMVTYLDQNPDKAAAWASTENIKTSQITSYVSGLTPVLLRTDTRVTNHGFVNGSADAYQSVLEAGTAVLVNKYGEPVVRCYCGNPLTPPVRYSTPIYTGVEWSGFTTTSITIIQQSITIIDIFTLYDPNTGETFTRPAGTDGSRDGPYQQQPTPAAPGITSTPAPAPQQPPTQAPPPQAAESPSASFNPSSGVQGDTFVLSASGFRPNANLDVTLTRPDGVVEHYTIAADASGSGSYTFTNTQNVVTGVYTATVTNSATGASAQASVSVAPSAQPGNTPPA